MRFTTLTPRVSAACAISIAHVWVIYAAFMAAPQTDAPVAVPTMSVQFIAHARPRSTWRPQDAVLTPPAIVASAPTLPPVEMPIAANASSGAISAPQPSAEPDFSQDRSVPKFVAEASYLRAPSPRYPSQSRRLREEGVVVLRVLIDEQGQARQISVDRSSGHARLDRAAREAVASAAFRPYVEDGAPRATLVLIPIEFFLNHPGKQPVQATIQDGGTKLSDVRS